MRLFFETECSVFIIHLFEASTVMINLVLFQFCWLFCLVSAAKKPNKVLSAIEIGFWFVSSGCDDQLGIDVYVEEAYPI